MNILQNESLIIESKSSGAELTRIYSKKNKKDILWCGDNKYWGRRSPILFPIVGRLKDNKTIIENNTYNMVQHGFARDMEFEILETTQNSVTYILKSNELTKSFYPYSFELYIKYVLVGSSVSIEWKVKNTDNKDILFSIGAHPAFNVPTNNGEFLDDYSLKFKSRGRVEQITLNGPYFNNSIEIYNIELLNLKADLFRNDAIIYTNIDEISIVDNLGKENISVEFKDFPLVGIWTPYYENGTVAPFICIEPWYGIADNINTDYQYKNKSFINKLKINETFNASYKISIL